MTIHTSLLRLRYVVAVIIPAAVLLGYFCASRTVDPPRQYSENTWTTVVPLADNSSAQLTREMFRLRLEQYRARCDSLGNTIYYWVLLLGLTALVLCQNEKETFSVLSVPVPAGARHAFVAVTSVYLWVEFGAELKELILERMTLWKLLDILEGPTELERTISLTSWRPLLRGKAFLDGWFTTFLPEYSMRAQGSASAVVACFWTSTVWFVFTVMIGLSHASAYTILEDASLVCRQTRAVRSTIIGGLLIIALVIVGCDMWFVIDGFGPSFFAATACTASIGILWFPKLRQFRIPQASSGQD
jgi:hypothetical protein